MHIDKQIGRVLVAGFDSIAPTPEIIDLIEHFSLGGVILFSRNCQDASQVRRLTRQLQTIARAAGHHYPLLIMLDQENGRVRRLVDGVTAFPGNMALGAVGSELLVRDIASAVGFELRELGITMNLAPVVDVNNNANNPVIGVRAFGEEPSAVARLGSAMVRGYRDAGIISCVKHFPGHGDTRTDSHLALPSIPYPVERLEQIELVPFRHAISAGVECVMIAHILFPALMQENLQPSTLSPVIVEQLLRQRLGFSGVIVSDCLEMKAIAGTIGVAQASVKALQAGIDLILISHHYAQQQAGIQAIQAAIADNTLAPQRLLQAAERVSRLKERYLSWDTALGKADQARSICFSHEVHVQLSQRAYALATTLVRNTHGIVPLHLASEQRILIIYPQNVRLTQAEDRRQAKDFLIALIKKYHMNAEAIPLDDEGENFDAISQIAAEADLVVIVMVNASHNLWQAAIVHTLLQSDQPVIGVAAYNPYDLLAFPDLATYLVTYEYTEPALAAAVDVLFGVLPASGRLPVTLPL